MGAEAAIVIERVEVVGAVSLAPSEIENAVELAGGEKLDRAKAVRSAANLTSLFRLHGFEQVKVETRLVRKKKPAGGTEDVLEFAIDEGKPTRIARITIIPEGIQGEPARKFWAGLVPTLASKLALQPGEILDQERISAARRNIQDALVSREFVGARADDVRVLEAGPPPATLGFGAEALAAARWVHVEFHVRAGDRVTFGFRGNSVLGHSRLLALVEDQRVIGFGKDYITAIRGRIEEEYRALGYYAARVEHRTFEDPSRQERHVTYEVHEGPRYRIDSVDFDGNEAFTNEELREQFFLRGSALLRQRHFSEKDVQKAAELVVEWMKSRGYLSAKLVTISTRVVPRKRVSDATVRVELTIYVYEWDQTLVREVRIKGAQAIGEPEIKRLLTLKEGEPLNLFAFSEGIEALKAAYLSKGYLGFRIANEGTDRVVRYSAENRYASVELELLEGPQYRAGRIVVEGLVDTHEKVVLRQLQFREGDILEEHRISESEARLRRLGIFSVVTIRATDDPDREGYKVIRVSVQEGTPGVLGGGVGFRNDLGVRLFAGVAYTNLLHENHTLAFDANLNHRVDDTYRFFEYQAQLSYIWPWFLLDEMNFRPAITGTGRQYKLFDATTVSASLTWEKRLHSRLTGIFSYSLERVNQFHAADPIDNQGLTIGAVVPAFRYDTRDNPLAPTSGYLVSGSFELALPELGSSGDDFPVGYSRTQLRADGHYGLAKDVSLFTSVRFGFVRNNEAPTVNPKSGSVPLIKQFALGGAGSLRGFREQELNDQDFAIRGTQSYVNYRIQLDLPFSGALRFGPFIDAANLQHDAFSLGNLRYGGGLGFHYQTPVGPVNLDYGFKLDPRVGEDSSLLYFSIGVI